MVIAGATGEARACTLLAVVCRHAEEVHLAVPKQSRACSHAQLEALAPAGFAGRLVRGAVENFFPGPGVCTVGGPDDTSSSPARSICWARFWPGSSLTRLRRGPLQDF